MSELKKISLSEFSEWEEIRIDREELKQAVREVLAEDACYFRTLITGTASLPPSLPRPKLTGWQNPQATAEALGIPKSALDAKRRNNLIILNRHYRLVTGKAARGGREYEYNVDALQEWMQMGKAEQSKELAKALKPGKGK